MNLTIKPLTEDLNSAYLEFFDNRAFSETDENGPCYCTSPMQTSDEIDQMVSEFAGDVKGTIRRHAVKMLGEGKIHGYLAFYGDSVIGWCNAGEMNKYIENRYQFVPDFARGNAVGKTMSVVCFSVAPEYRGKGVSTALLERVVADAKAEGFEAVEGYVHIRKEQYDFDFKGPKRLYEKLGFVAVAEHDGVVVMRKALKEELHMTRYEEVLKIMDERFGHDSLISIATIDGDRPAVRTVDGFYENGSFYTVTHALSGKMQQIKANSKVAVCGEWFTGHGIGENLGYIRAEQNTDMASKLRAVFAEWYDNGHTDESDPNTVILRVRLTDGVLFSHGTRYDVDFENQKA